MRQGKRTHLLQCALSRKETHRFLLEGEEERKRKQRTYHRRTSVCLVPFCENQTCGKLYFWESGKAQKRTKYAASVWEEREGERNDQAVHVSLYKEWTPVRLFSFFLLHSSFTTGPAAQGPTQSGRKRKKQSCSHGFRLTRKSFASCGAKIHLFFGHTPSATCLVLCFSFFVFRFSIFDFQFPMDETICQTFMNAKLEKTFTIFLQKKFALKQGFWRYPTRQLVIRMPLYEHLSNTTRETCKEMWHWMFRTRGNVRIIPLWLVPSPPSKREGGIC